MVLLPSFIIIYQVLLSFIIFYYFCIFLLLIELSANDVVVQRVLTFLL
nr:MAG TPA: hypothetical protein [Caudoviricetes sp.]